MSALNAPNGGTVLRSLSSSGPTFLFVAGLDGTGHHFWADALGSCSFCVPAPKSQAAAYSLWYAPNSSTGETSCQAVAKAGRALVEYASARALPSGLNSSSASHCPTDLDIPKQAAGTAGKKQALVDAMRDEAAGFRPGTIAALNLLSGKHPMMSYPAMGLRNCCPDVRSLALAAVEVTLTLTLTPTPTHTHTHTHTLSLTLTRRAWASPSSC